MELKDNHQAQALGRAGAESNPFNGIESKDVYTALVGVETRVGIHSMELKVRVYCWAWG